MRLACLTAALIAAASIAGGSAREQPAGTAGEQVSTRPAESDPDRDAMRARLQRRLEETRRAQERLERALEALDAGASTAEIRQHLRGGDGRPGRGPREGPEGQGDRPGRAEGTFESDPVFRALREHAPELAERLRRGMREDPRLTRRVVAWLGPRLRELAGERDAALIRLRVAELREAPEIAEATRALARATLAASPDAAAIDSARARLRASLERQHDLRVQIHHREIELLSQRLDRLRAEVSRGPEDRERVVTERLGEIEAVIERHRGRRMERTPPAGGEDGGGSGAPDAPS